MCSYAIFCLVCVLIIKSIITYFRAIGLTTYKKQHPYNTNVLLNTSVYLFLISPLGSNFWQTGKLECGQRPININLDAFHIPRRILIKFYLLQHQKTYMRLSTFMHTWPTYVIASLF